MPRNKPRLQIAFYARPKHPGTYHYALFIAAKSGEAAVTKHHVKNKLEVNTSGEVTQLWRYEKIHIEDIKDEQRLIIRVVIAKVTKQRETERILENMPVCQSGDINLVKAQVFSCRTWARDAYQELQKQGAIGVKSKKWEEIEQASLQYLQKKLDQGRWSDIGMNSLGVPLLDLIADREIFE